MKNRVYLYILIFVDYYKKIIPNEKIIFLPLLYLLLLPKYFTQNSQNTLRNHLKQMTVQTPSTVPIHPS